MAKYFEYHTKQYIEPKRSTVMFVDWLRKNVSLENKNIIDVACGGEVIRPTWVDSFQPQIFSVLIMMKISYH